MERKPAIRLYLAIRRLACYVASVVSFYRVATASHRTHSRQLRKDTASVRAKKRLASRTLQSTFCCLSYGTLTVLKKHPTSPFYKLNLV